MFHHSLLRYSQAELQDGPQPIRTGSIHDVNERGWSIPMSRNIKFMTPRRRRGAIRFVLENVPRESMKSMLPHLVQRPPTYPNHPPPDAIGCSA